jgi:outer membrane protein insertion porin family
LDFKNDLVLYYHLIFCHRETLLTKTFSFVNQLLKLPRRYREAAIIFLLIVTFPLYASAESGPLIKSIEIKGNRKVSTDTITSKMKSKVGEPFSESVVQEDIKKLYAIGYFDDIRVDIDAFEGGVGLIFVFKEKRTITSIDFQGNKEYAAKDLKEKITITPGAVANLPLITDNAQKLIAYYQSEGYWLVSVLPIIREISEDAAALTFQIEEGPKIEIKDIVIEGNKFVSSKAIKKVMQTKKWWLFSFITGSGVYQKEQIYADLDRIKDLYLNKGFINAAISEPEITLSKDKKKLSIKISISEGNQYKIGTLNIKGNTIFSEAELRQKLKIAPGQIFNRGALRTDIDSILDLYMEKGYALSEVNPLIDVNPQERLANITLSVTEGDIFRIGTIQISGNTKTRDKVIRREMRLSEGDIFNKKLLKRSFQRINNLNFFENVDIAPAPRVAEKLIDLNVNVKEKLTGMLSIGGGYSSIDKFMVMGEITQANLFGKGLYLKFKANFSALRTDYNISLRDPWFMDKPISASVSLYNESVIYPDYDKKATGGSVGFGKELSEYVSANITYDLEKADITNISVDASDIIKDQEGARVTSSISPSIWKDTRDNYLDPTSGYRHALYLTVAGLGGDNYFVKELVDSVVYFPYKWDTTFSLRGRLGFAAGFNGRKLPLYERFYIGGINTVRGLGFGEAGPKDANGKEIGGNVEGIFNAEYIFPIAADLKLKGVTFFDYGSSFDKDIEKISLSDMRKTAGLGVRWISPFGPIRLEWGFNLDPKEGETRSKLEFSIGGFF